ncbi:hypothetical protein PG993_011505 [Apiospora rasikravindrae]|uniref:Uncharacterized protein n=1 Tax=Apiospora rasikravindrae TaxID=990691 RepID=A0ABR1SEF6_9PEZI
MSVQSPITSPESPQGPEEEENAKTRNLDITALNGEHRDLLTRAIGRVVSTEIAEVTYAQLLDGLPLAEVAFESNYDPLHNKHPIRQVHQQLCPGIMEEARKFRDEFKLETLQFDAKVRCHSNSCFCYHYCHLFSSDKLTVKLLFEFQAAASGSRSFKNRLLELVVVAIHQLAVLLYRVGETRHKDDGVHDWKPPESDELYWEFHPSGPLPTMFQHAWYIDYDQYPEGVADMAAYWAESRIMGGVVLFDRRDPAADLRADPSAVYIHPDKYDAPYRIVQLLPEQRQALLDFLIGQDQPAKSLLPLTVDENNTKRVDPEEPIRETGIYRDLWERKDFPPDATDSRLRDVWDTFNFPTTADKEAAGDRAWERKMRLKYGDQWESSMDEALGGGQ